MAINFPEGTQNLPATIVNFKDYYYNTIANYSGSNTSFDEPLLEQCKSAV